MKPETKQMAERLMYVAGALPLDVDEFFDVAPVMQRLGRMLADPAAGEREAALEAGAEMLKRYDQPKILSRKYPAAAPGVKAPAVEPDTVALLERYKVEVAARPEKELTKERRAEIEALLADTEAQGKTLDPQSVFNLYRDKWVPEALASGDAELIEKRVRYFEGAIRNAAAGVLMKRGGLQ